MNEKRYQSYVRVHWPLPFVQPWLYGPAKLAKKPFKYDFILCTHLGNKSGWHYYVDDFINMGHVLDNYLAIPKNLEQLRVQAEKVRKENYDFSKNIEKLDIGKTNLNELVDFFRQWYLVHSKFCADFMFIDATDETLENDIRETLAKSKISLSFSEIACLFTPDVESYVQKEHREFCQIVKNKESPEFLQAIENYVKRWWWSPMGWSQHQPLTVQKVKEDILKIEDSDALIAKQNKEEQQRIKLLEQKEKIIKILPEEVSNLLDVFEVLAEMHDTRKEIQMRMMKTGFTLAEAILKKSSIPMKYRDFMLVEEYFDLTKGVKPSLSVLQSREKAFWCQITSKSDVLMLSGEEALGKLEESKIYEPEKDKQEIIKGTPASPGKFKGVVRVELDQKVLINNFKLGEILVTGMTTPDFVPAMKKAGAIITDEGGITCHGAIIAREFKKPCIVGTRIATQILKDGDFVEVDANNGIVRILKRNQSA
jgi:phosphohistidine swiveling domain-containing protein